METEKLLTAKDLTARLNVSTETAYELMHNNNFPSFIIGRRYYVSESNLSEWLVKTANKKDKKFAIRREKRR